MGDEMRGRDDGVNVNNVQYKPNQNCHYESPPVYWIYLNKNTIRILKIHIMDFYVIYGLNSSYNSPWGKFPQATDTENYIK
jgi:hypothetical protein